MCLAVPSRIVAIREDTATVDFGGINRDISVLLLEDPQVGDYVIVHAGFALHKIDDASARGSFALLQEAATIIDDGT